MNTKGFIFDLDGVIVDTAKYHFLAWQKLAKSIDVNFTQEQNEQLKGVSRVRSLEKILEWGNKTISETDFKALMAKKNDDYLSYISNMNDNEILQDVPKILDDVSKAKPDPEVFLIAAKLLNIKPENCIVFEDSVAGVQAANTANMISVGIGKKSVLHEADYVFSGFTEISTSFIQDLINR